MTLSLVVTAAGVAALLFLPNLSLGNFLESARPAGISVDQPAALNAMVWPDEARSHEESVHQIAWLVAFCTALAGFLLATTMYCWRKLDAAEVRQQFEPLYQFLAHKWWLTSCIKSSSFVPHTGLLGSFEPSIRRSLMGSSMVSECCQNDRARLGRGR